MAARKHTNGPHRQCLNIASSGYGQERFAISLGCDCPRGHGRKDGISVASCNSGAGRIEDVGSSVQRSYPSRDKSGVNDLESE